MKVADSDQKRRDALDDLERVQHEGGLLSGWLRHTTAAENDMADPHGDPIERWGRRIGRSLAIVAFLGLCVYLYLTHAR